MGEQHRNEERGAIGRSLWVEIFNWPWIFRPRKRWTSAHWPSPSAWPHVMPGPRSTWAGLFGTNQSRVSCRSIMGVRIAITLHFHYSKRPLIAPPSFSAKKHLKLLLPISERSLYPFTWHTHSILGDRSASSNYYIEQSIYSQVYRYAQKRTVLLILSSKFKPYQFYTIRPTHLPQVLCVSQIEAQFYFIFRHACRQRNLAQS